MFFYQMSLPLPASSQNSTKMKNHSSLLYIIFIIYNDSNSDRKVHTGICCRDDRLELGRVVVVAAVAQIQGRRSNPLLW